MREQTRDSPLRRVLEPYAGTTPGYFLYFPSRTQSPAPLRYFIDAAKELVRAI